jgi:hypothetical protein
MTRPDFSGWLARPPYGSEAQAKDAAMTAAMNELTEWHATQCAPYRRMLTLLGAAGHAARTLDEVPYLPVRLFKEMDLRSVDAQAVFKTLSSSGTTGQQVSRIHLDRDNAAMQTRVLGRLVGDALGHKRLPMLVIDSPAVLKDRQAFSARGAGILGFSVFGLDRSFALDADMRIDLPAIEAFLQRHAGRPLLVFGFTYMIWAHFLQALRERGLCLPLADGVLLHGGGWKKLAAQAVDAAEFRRVVQQCTGMTRVVNYYGMVEQTGVDRHRVRTGAIACVRLLRPHRARPGRLPSAGRRPGRPDRDPVGAAAELPRACTADRGHGAHRRHRRLPLRPPRQDLHHHRQAAQGRAARLQRHL